MGTTCNSPTMYASVLQCWMSSKSSDPENHGRHATTKDHWSGAEQMKLCCHSSFKILWILAVLHRLSSAQHNLDSGCIPHCKGRWFRGLFRGMATWFSTLNADLGYWQVLIAEEDWDQTLFTCHFGISRFPRILFVLPNAPTTFHRTLYILIGRFN